MTAPVLAPEIAAIWRQHRPAMGERLDALDLAAAGLAAGSLATAVRESALDAAHKLAGTAGTFGFDHTSVLARRAEGLLRADPTPEQAPELADFVAGIREELELPAAVPDRRPAAPLPLVLLVTSDESAAERLRIEAARLALRLVASANVEAAQRQIERSRPDALVLDLSTPDAAALMNGLDPDVRVIALAAAADARTRREVAALGVDTFLERDATPVVVVDALALALQRRWVPRPRVLALTADHATADALHAMLAPAGIAVETRSDEDGVWEALAAGPAPMLLIDADLPGADALELCRAVRQDPLGATVPLVLLSHGDAAPALAAGADDHLPKPVAGADALARLQQRLERFRVQQALSGRDALTGLDDRRTAAAALGARVRLAERLDRPLCVVAIETLDPSLLRPVAERLRQSLRGEDVIARWSADGFVVGMFGTERKPAIERMASLATAGFRAGVAQYPQDGRNLAALYAAAREALEAAAAGDDSVSGTVGAHQTTQQVDVAIVEDEDAVSALINFGLSERGYRCWRFSNGAGAVSMLAGPSPSVRARVILLDLNLPAVDGIELLTLLARDGVLRSSRVVVVSGNDDPSVMERCRAIGASEYLVKPVSIERIAEAVDEALGRRDG